MKVELDLPNYRTKADLKNAAGVDISKIAKKLIYQAENLKLINYKKYQLF